MMTQGGAVVAQAVHTRRVAGSIPAPATNLPRKGLQPPLLPARCAANLAAHRVFLNNEESSGQSLTIAKALHFFSHRPNMVNASDLVWAIGV